MLGVITAKTINIMTQKEFDRIMASLNEAQALELNPIMDKMNEINRQRTSLKLRMMDLKMKYVELGAEYRNLSEKRREVNTRYHSKKHQLIMDNPKDSMEEEKEDLNF